MGQHGYTVLITVFLPLLLIIWASCLIICLYKHIVNRFVIHQFQFLFNHLIQIGEEQNWTMSVSESCGGEQQHHHPQSSTSSTPAASKWTSHLHPVRPRHLPPGQLPHHVRLSQDEAGHQSQRFSGTKILPQSACLHHSWATTNRRDVPVTHGTSGTSLASPASDQWNNKWIEIINIRIPVTEIKSSWMECW